jgi:hypothetical protein
VLFGRVRAGDEVGVGPVVRDDPAEFVLDPPERLRPRRGHQTAVLSDERSGRTLVVVDDFERRDPLRTEFPRVFTGPFQPTTLPLRSLYRSPQPTLQKGQTLCRGVNVRSGVSVTYRAWSHETVNGGARSRFLGNATPHGRAGSVSTRADRIGVEERIPRRTRARLRYTTTRVTRPHRRGPGAVVVAVAGAQALDGEYSGRSFTAGESHGARQLGRRVAGTRRLANV